MTTGLNGARVLVTRPAAQAEALCQLIAEQGGRAVRFPTLAIAPVAAAETAIAHVLNADWLIFTSTNAVDFALRAFDGKMLPMHAVRLAAVGEATANALRQAGLKVACVPQTDFSSEGLLAEAPMQAVAGQLCVIVRGVGGREKLAQTLRGRGAEVGYWEVYRRERPETDTTELVGLLQSNTLAAVTITSGEALQNLLSLVSVELVQKLWCLPLVVVSDRIAQTAQQLGFKRITVSRQPTDAAVAETLMTLLSGENSGRSN